MEKYKQYVELQWWNGIEKRDIENWIRNFGTNKKLAKLILDNVIFYNISQMKAYTRCLVNKLKEEVYIDQMKKDSPANITDVMLYEQWNTYIRKTRFLPAAQRNDSSSSSYKVIGYWRGVLGCGDEPISSIGNIVQDYTDGIKRFVLVDDFSGSGSQLMSVLKQKIIYQNQEIEIGKISDFIDDVELIVSLYVIHENAIKVIEEEFPKIKILYVDKIDEQLNYTNDNSLMYDKIDEDTKNKFINEINRINEQIVKEEPRLQELSSYVLNIPIVFEHGCPNNTLLLLFAHTDNWQQLFKRGIEL